MLKLRDDVVEWREVGDQILLLDKRHDRYLEINPSAAVLWRLLAQGTSRSALVQALAENYGLNEQRATSDVARFLEDCLARELIVDDEL